MIIFGNGRRKRTLGVIAAIFLCPAITGRRQTFAARESAFYESVQLAEELMRRIDARWPRDRVPGKT
jgi:hypothetical protein